MARRSAAALLLLAAVAGCSPDADAPPETESQPTLADAADSLAARIETAAGGRAAFHALPALRFDFGSIRDSVERPRRHHLWDRVTGRYRLEWTAGDSQLVALFSTQEVAEGLPAGSVYFQGIALDSADAAGRLRSAYRMFINDSYWLLAPLKLFDPGVMRSVARDSADADTEVLAVHFQGVGLTPGDRYWLRASRETGRLRSWRFILESGGTGAYAWEEPQEVSGPAGSLTLDARKTALEGGGAILTPATAAEIEEADFTDPRPRLSRL